MKKIILKTTVFVLPFIIIHLIGNIFYLKIPGDLIRVGLIYSIPGYRDVFSTKITINSVTQVSELSKTNKRKFDILTIGDSFSNQDLIGYNNYIANLSPLTVLNLNGKLNSNLNPIQTVMDFANGDVLDSLDVDFIVLQLVERQSASRRNIIENKSVIFDSIINKPLKKLEENSSTSFFSNTTLKLLFTNFSYLFNNKPYYSKTFRVKSTKPLFSNKPAEILFSEEDVSILKDNNNLNNIKELNDKLNFINRRLDKKDIKLIVLICPDKYDLYYDYILDKGEFTKPIFFESFKDLSKKYLYVNAKKKITDEIELKNDLYFYDDTHWSPHSAKIVAKEIIRTIMNERTTKPKLH